MCKKGRIQFFTIQDHLLHILVLATIVMCYDGESLPAFQVNGCFIK